VETRQLRYFVGIIECGSFTKAASILRIAQPALSHQIQNLEEEIGTTLLVRHPKGVVPTSAGTTLYEHAIVILRQLDRAKAETVARASKVTGDLAVGLPPSVCLYLAAPLVERFRTLCPDVRLNIVESFGGHLEEWLIGGKLDLAVLYSPVSSKLMHVEPLSMEDLVLVGPAKSDGQLSKIETADQLATLPLVLPSRRHGLRSMVDAAAAAHDIRLRVDLEIDTLPLIKELVVRGGGYTILPFSGILQEYRTGILSAWKIPNFPLVRQLVLARMKDRPVSTPAAEFHSALFSITEELAPKLRWTEASVAN